MMLIFGQLCLLGALVTSGFAAFASLAAWRQEHRTLGKSAVYSAVASVLLLTLVMVLLAHALVTRDFRFAYVAQYCSQLLPWHYCLSALWVGQAGSLLLWAWLLGLLAMIFRFVSPKQSNPLRDPAFGLLMAYYFFLVATMVFAADPMAGNIAPPREGVGLSPLLQHPAMLIHPPIVFLGYAAWAIPFALATAALVSGHLDARWTHLARPWAIFAWAVLGAGILLGAEWAYEELGWGGYWGWDPVENGSLIPWLTGTAFLHTLMTWRHRGMLKKTSVGLAIATFALCNFATFLTRSGIFSSLHAFSQSSIGWLFLALMVVLAVGGGFLVYLRRANLTAENQISAVFSREAMVSLSTIAFLLLVVVTCVGTLSVALSDALLGYKIMVGPPFYNNVLIPIGLLVLGATALAPLLHWGSSPNAIEKRILIGSAAVGGLVFLVVIALGVRNAIMATVAGLVVFAVVVLIGSLLLDVWQRNPGNYLAGLFGCLRDRRRQYAGFLVHLGFFSLALGVAGTSLGARRYEVDMQQGQTAQWAGYSIRLVGLVERKLSDKLVAEAVLEISQNGEAPYKLSPGQHFHRLQNEWTTEVAIRSSWRGDLYVILHGSAEEDHASLTFVENPMMRWLWLGGGTMLLGAVVSLWPNRRCSRESVLSQPVKIASRKNSISTRPIKPAA